MADYWLKLYIEILDDPKMATLPDRVWRRVIELFLVAKRLNKDGHLPDTRQIAWMLRMSPDELESDMAQITQTGIILREVNGWLIPKFTQRQAAVPPAERKAQQREREQSQQYYGDVTDLSRSVTQRTETEAETEAEAESDNFTFIRGVIVRETGIPPDGKNSIDAIDEMVKLNCTEGDILAGITWLKGQGKPIKYYSSIVGPTRTAMQKRTQGSNGYKPAGKMRTVVNERTGKTKQVPE